MLDRTTGQGSAQEARDISGVGTEIAEEFEIAATTAHIVNSQIYIIGGPCHGEVLTPERVREARATALLRCHIGLAKHARRLTSKPPQPE